MRQFASCSILAILANIVVPTNGTKFLKMPFVCFTQPFCFIKRRVRTMALGTTWGPIGDKCAAPTTPAIGLAPILTRLARQRRIATCTAPPTWKRGCLVDGKFLQITQDGLQCFLNVLSAPHQGGGHRGWEVGNRSTGCIEPTTIPYPQNYCLLQIFIGVHCMLACLCSAVVAFFNQPF